MRTTEFIKRLTDRQLEIAFIILGVYFKKSEYINTQDELFKDIAKEGIKTLADESIVLSNQFTVSEIMDLLKIEMFKRGIE